MKARIKATGEVVKVQWDSAYAREYYDTHFWYSPERNLHFHERELDFDFEERESKEEKKMWKEREWQAAVAIMAGLQLNSEITLEDDAELAVKGAKALVAEYRKGGKDE